MKTLHHVFIGLSLALAASVLGPPPDANAQAPACIDGDPCSDGDKCTINDICSGGKCAAGAPADCNDSNICTTDTCVPADGCLNVNNFLACDDKNPCTLGDVCADGTCNGPTPNDCKDGIPCTDDSCGINGCVHTPNAASCDDGNPCTDDSCGLNGCVNTPNAASCTDGNACTHNDICSGGACTGMAVICDDGDLCNGIETCDPTTGQCGGGGQAGPAFLFCSEARLNNRIEIGGDVTVNAPDGTLRIARDAVAADGTTMTANEIILGVNASIDNAKYNSVSLTRGSVIRGTQMSPVALPVFSECCPIPAKTCTGTEPAVTIGKNETHAPLTPGSYGSLSTLNNGKIVLMPGEYTFCGDMLIARNAELTTMGSVTINVTGDFRIGNLSVIGPKAGSPTPALNVAGSMFRLGQAAHISAMIKAPNAEGHFARASKITGTMCLDSAITDKSLTWSCGAP